MNTTPAIFCLRIAPELRAAIGRAARKSGLPMNEYIARVMATHFRRPKLAVIPRISRGRPRVRLV